MNKTVSVWLTVEDGENKGKIVLQQRGAKNSFPFVCQATWSGKVEEGEDLETAIKRECKEELGEEFYKRFDFSTLKFFCKEKFRMKNVEWESNNYSGTVSQFLLNVVKMHDEAIKDFIFADESEEDVIFFDDDRKVFKKILNGNKRNNK